MIFTDSVHPRGNEYNLVYNSFNKSFDRAPIVFSYACVWLFLIGRVYVRQLIYYGVSPLRKNASVFYGDKSSLKHFASIDLSGNKKSKDGQKSFPRLTILFVFLPFYFSFNHGNAYDRVRRTLLLFSSRISRISSRSISTITMDRKEEKGRKWAAWRAWSLVLIIFRRDYDLARISCGQEHRD